MPIIAKNGGGQGLEPIPSGLEEAVCHQIIDIGTHFDEKYKKSNRKVIIAWELPAHTYVRDGAELPRTISKRYTLSLGEKSTLRAHLQNWRGRPFTEKELEGFDLENVLGACCQLQIMEKVDSITGKGRNTIEGIAAWPRRAQRIEPTLEKRYFALDDWTGGALPNWMPEWVAKLIVESEEYKAKAGAPATHDEAEVPADDPAAEDDNLPF